MGRGRESGQFEQITKWKEEIAALPRWLEAEGEKGGWKRRG